MSWKKIYEPTKEEISAYMEEHRGKARFLVDENLGVDVATLTKEWGWNVKYINDVGLIGQPDEKVFAYARKQNRIILTHDKDFLDDQKYPLKISPGVVVLPGASGNNIALIRALSIISAFRHLGDFFEHTQVQVNDDGVFTVRNYNKNKGRIEKKTYRFTKNGPPEELEDSDKT